MSKYKASMVSHVQATGALWNRMNMFIGQSDDGKGLRRILTGEIRKKWFFIDKNN